MAKQLENPFNRLRSAFNVPDSVTIINVRKPGEKEEEFQEQTAPEQDAALYTSKLGTPVLADLEFLQDTYETGENGINKLIPSIKCAAVLITVSQAKKIVRTEIQGRNGTIKEYIGLDDYEVTINGVLTGDNGVRPVQEIADLKAMLDAPVAIGVASAYLQALGIDQIVVESYELAQDEGSYSYQTFSINALSDAPQELRLTNA